MRVSVLDEVSEAQMCGRGYWRHALGASKADAVSIFVRLLPQPPELHLLRAHQDLLMKNKRLHVHALAGLGNYTMFVWGVLRSEQGGWQ